MRGDGGTDTGAGIGDHVRLKCAIVTSLVVKRRWGKVGGGQGWFKLENMLKARMAGVRVREHISSRFFIKLTYRQAEDGHIVSVQDAVAESDALPVGDQLGRSFRNFREKGE